MNNNQPDNSKQSQQRRSLCFVAFASILSLAIGFLLPFLWRPTSPDVRDIHEVIQIVAILVGGAGLLILVPAYLFPVTFSRLFNRETIPRQLFGLACIATLIASFYAIENWRGKRAWENCKKELEAKGAVLNWAAYIPPTVPDEQNIYKAPKMAEWFVKEQMSWAIVPSTNQPYLVKLLDFRPFMEERDTIATVALVSGQSAVGLKDSEFLLEYKDSKLLLASAEQSTRLRDELETLIRSRGEEETVEGTPILKAAQNFNLIAKGTELPKPLQIIIRGDKAPTSKELTGFLSTHTTAALVVKESVTNSFRVSLNLRYGATVVAADYLKFTDQHQTELSLIRDALSRPYSRIEGDYTQPFSSPIPNYISVRVVAHTLAQRSQCYLLLKQPEEALRELTLLHKLRSLLEQKPTGQSMFLVSAMINVAVTGIYGSVIADGFRLQVWDEPQIAAIADQLKQVNLTLPVIAALKSEQVAILHTLLHTRNTDMDEAFFRGGGRKTSIWRKFKNATWWSINVGPEGWIYQNAVTVASLQQKYIDGLNPSHDLVAPERWNTAMKEINQALEEHRTPYNIIARIAIPNFSRAIQATSKNETLAQQALIACALESYRRAHNDYPETLEALSPKFLDVIPKDLIGGQPLKYRRTDDKQFVLYSIGWNEKDDGGLVKTESLDAPDWVW